DPGVVDSLPTLPSPSAQILSDLNTLNAMRPLSFGSAPIETWIENAAALAGGRAEAQVFLEVLEATRESVRAPPDERDEPLFLVPFRKDPHFVGREDDLEELHALLQKSE